MLDNRQELLTRWITGGTAANGYVAAPGSGATITLWDSGSNDASGTKGARWRRLIISTYSSHVSATNGLTVDESWDNGTNWDNVGSYTVSATTYTKTYASVAAPRVRVRYANSANVLTSWRGGIVGDEYERATQ